MGWFHVSSLLWQWRTSFGTPKLMTNVHFVKSNAEHPTGTERIYEILHFQWRLSAERQKMHTKPFDSLFFLDIAANNCNSALNTHPEKIKTIELFRVITRQLAHTISSSFVVFKVLSMKIQKCDEIKCGISSNESKLRENKNKHKKKQGKSGRRHKFQRKKEKKCLIVCTGSWCFYRF